jgi:hypothetical protein
MASPSLTYNAAGNLITSSSLGAGANTTADIDASTKFAVKIVVKNTPGGTVAATRGLKIEVLEGYGSSVVYTTVSLPAATLPSAVASTAESMVLEYGPGKYRLRLTNLDASNAVTIEASTVTIDSIA